MRNLPNIEISRKHINLMLMSPFSVGGEAVICHGYDIHTLYKFFLGKQKGFSMFYNFRDLREMQDSKLEKIKLLYEMNLEDSVQPISTITCEKRLIGYEMTYDEDDISFAYPSTCKTRDDIIYYADYIKRVLDYYASKDIAYVDVAGRNILINKKTRSVKFCDMDNIKIDEYEPEAISVDLIEYDEIRGIDNQVDAYMHNLMLMRKLGLEPNNCLEDDSLFLFEFDERALPILKGIKDPKEFNGEYAIQYVKRR